MKKIVFSFLFATLCFALSAQDAKIVFAVHGGAGNVTPDRITKEKREDYEQALKQALKTGYRVLQSGEAAEDAVKTAINILEDNPLFNAGRGSVFTHHELIDMDASIMTGKDLNAGAVTGVQTVKNPINAAFAVLKHSNHVLLSGKGAEEFASKNHVESTDPEWFKTERRLNYLRELKKQSEEKNDTSGILPGNQYSDYGDAKFGTVGAVALDMNGNLAAGTSTGGMTNKKYNRIGDSPIIGAGTYANNATCAVSSTGYGEYFMRRVTAYDISAMMEFGGMDLIEASKKAVDRMTKTGGYGGVIALDHNGNINMPFSTAGMFRGYIDENGGITVKMFGAEDDD